MDLGFFFNTSSPVKLAFITLVYHCTRHVSLLHGAAATPASYTTKSSKPPPPFNYTSVSPYGLFCPFSTNLEYSTVPAFIVSRVIYFFSPFEMALYLPSQTSYRLTLVQNLRRNFIITLHFSNLVLYISGMENVFKKRY